MQGLLALSNTHPHTGGRLSTTMMACMSVPSTMHIFQDSTAFLDSPTASNNGRLTTKRSTSHAVDSSMFPSAIPYGKRSDRSTFEWARFSYGTHDYRTVSVFLSRKPMNDSLLWGTQATFQIKVIDFELFNTLPSGRPKKTTKMNRKFESIVFIRANNAQ